MDFPKELRYTREHEWARPEGDQIVVGITDFAQDELGDVVYLDLPQEGDRVARMEPFGTVESVKAVSDLYSPLSGTVVTVNGELSEKPELVNQDPYGQGWMIVIKFDSKDELEALMGADEYGTYVTEQKETH
jgi:glycine cleavage system H protein